MCGGISDIRPVTLERLILVPRLEQQSVLFLLNNFVIVLLKQNVLELPLSGTNINSMLNGSSNHVPSVAEPFLRYIKKADELETVSHCTLYNINLILYTNDDFTVLYTTLT